MEIAPKGHRFWHIPHPMHRVSEIAAFSPIFMQSSPFRLIGQSLAQRFPHLSGKHDSFLTIASLMGLDWKIHLKMFLSV